MKTILILLLAGAATPALAQHSGHTAPAPAAATSTCTPEHAAMGHCKLPAPPPAADPHAGHTMPAQQAPAATSTCTPEHAAMGHCKMPAPDTKPAVPATPAGNPTCTPEHAAMGHCKLEAPAQPAADPDAGHTRTQAADPHAGHAMSQSDIPVAPPPALARSGPEHGADLFYDPAAMASAREEMREHHGGLNAYKILMDQAEAKIRNGRDGYAWDGQAWYGGDIDKLWIKTEGEGEFRESVEKAEVQALWSRAIDPWFDLQLGIRHDFRPDPERTHLVMGVQGLAPYWFEVDGAVFLSDKGDVTARFEGEYDLRITQKLILQPRVELDLALQDVPEIGIGSGLSSGELGARLRYEISPQFAPYVGVEYERAFGDTARFGRARGEKAGNVSLLLGIRAWF